MRHYRCSSLPYIYDFTVFVYFTYKCSLPGYPVFGYSAPPVAKFQNSLPVLAGQLLSGHGFGGVLGCAVPRSPPHLTYFSVLWRGR